MQEGGGTGSWRRPLEAVGPVSGPREGKLVWSPSSLKITCQGGNTHKLEWDRSLGTN